MKKYIGLVLSMGILLAAGSALAAAAAPTPTPSAVIMQVTGNQQMQAQNGMRTVMPCPMMMNQAGGASNMMYRNPCGGMMTQNYMAYGLGQNMTGWLGLMFALTVLLVWVVLLLLIAVLWHMLKKHRRG